MSTIVSSAPHRGVETSRNVGVRLLGPLVALLLLGATVLVLHHDGVPAADLGRYALYGAWGLALPGFLVQRAGGGPARTWFADVVLSLTVGVALELIAWAVFVGAGWAGMLWIWPVVTLPLLLLPGARRRIVSKPRERQSVGVTCAVAVGLASLLRMCHLQALVVNPLPGRGAAIYQDLLWHMGLVYEARRSFPLKTPQVIDAGTLHYHWYSDAHMAAASLIAHVPVPVETERFFPVLFYFLGFGMTVVVVGEVARRASAMGAAALLAAATTTFSPFPGMYVTFASYISRSPSQLFAVPLTLAFLLFVHRFVQASRSAGVRSRSTASASVMVLLLLVALSGAKASAPPSVLGGVGLVWVWAMLTRQARAAISALLAVCAVGAGIALTLVVGGDAGSGKQLLAPLGAAPIYRVLLHPKGGVGWALPGSVLPGFGSHLVLSIALVGYTLVGAMVMWLPIALGCTRRGRREPFTWLASGTLLASMLAYLVINHPGLSEFYFMRGALSVGVVAFVYQGDLWWDRASERARKVVAAAGLVGGIAAIAVMVVNEPKRLVKADALFDLRLSVVVLGVVLVLVLIASRVLKLSAVALMAALTLGATTAETLYQPIATKEVAVRTTHRNSLTQAAGLWVEKHLPRYALLATNQHCVGREQLVCHSTQWWLSGLGGRRVLIEGWSYTPKSANRDPFFEPGLLRENQAAFTSADPRAIQVLKQRGVQYLVAVKGATALSPKLSEVGDTVYANALIKIVKLR